MAMSTLRNKFAGLSNSPVSLTPGNVLTQAEISAIDPAVIKSMKEYIAGEHVLKPDDIMATLEILAFEGFDPNIVYAHVAHIQKSTGTTWDQVKQDILILLVIHHLRGNVNASNMKSFKNEAKNLVNEMLSKYKVVLSKDVNKKLAITLPRLGAAFPFQMAQIAAVSGRDFSGFCDSSYLPSCMKSSSFPSLIPRGEKISLLLNLAYNSFACDQTVTIKKRNYLEMKEDDRKKLFQEQLRFTDISFNSPVIDEEHRKAAIFQLKIGTAAVYEGLKKTLKYSSVVADALCSETEYVSTIASFKTESDSVAAAIRGRIAAAAGSTPPAPTQVVAPTPAPAPPTTSPGPAGPI